MIFTILGVKLLAVNVINAFKTWKVSSMTLCGTHWENVIKKLTKKNCSDLVNSIKEVLKEAIKKGGSSINDYISVDGKSGYFQFDFKVYGRTSQPCHICQSDILQVKINQRSSFYCKNCQK